MSSIDQKAPVVDVEEGEPLDDEAAEVAGSGDSDQEILDEALDRYRLCVDASSENESLAVDDLRFLAGEQWPAAAKAQRLQERRPALTINTLPTYLHQVTNDQLQNKVSIHVHPVDDDADTDVAEVLEGLVRHIEYDSNSETCYDTAVNGASAIGFGYFRVVTEFCDEKSFDQDLRFKRIRNHLSVKLDPLSTELDGSDMQYAFIESPMAVSGFKREYPKAKASDSTQFGNHMQFAGWLDKETVLVCEYYRIVKKTKTLYLATDGKGYFKEEKLEPGVRLTSKKRETTECTVEWFKITSSDVLERTIIKCKWIPVFPVYGDEIDIEGKVIRMGIIRRAKDPSQMYNYWMTSATEEVAMRNKTPYIGAVGQFETQSEQWQDANNRTYSTLEYDPVTVDNTLAPAPQRQPMADVPVGVLAMAGHARDNIKATTGLFDSSLGARGNATSGIQEKAQQRQGDTANFHYTNNRNMTVRHAGRCLIDMIPYYYDTERVIRIMNEDGTADRATINQPIPLEQRKQDPETGAIKTVLNDLTVGKYDVAISAGPGYDTLRQESLDGMIAMSQSWPKLMDVAGDKVIAAMDWPGSTEIAERVKKTLAPGIADDEENKNEPIIQTPHGPLPLSQASQAIATMDQTMQQMHERVQELEKLGEENKAAEIAVKRKEVEVKDKEATTHRITADADLLRAEAEAQAAGINVQTLIGAGIKDALSQLMDMPIEQVAGLADHPELQPQAGGAMPPGMPPNGAPVAAAAPELPAGPMQ